MDKITTDISSRPAWEMRITHVIQPSGAVSSRWRIYAGEKMIAEVPDLGEATDAIARLLAASVQMLAACQAAYAQTEGYEVLLKHAIEYAEKGR